MSRQPTMRAYLVSKPSPARPAAISQPIIGNGNGNQKYFYTFVIEQEDLYESMGSRTVL